MALDLGDKAIVREIAREVAERIIERVQHVVVESTRTEVKVHMLECPLKMELKTTKEDLAAEQNRRKGAWGVIVLIATIAAALATIAVDLLRK